MIHIWVQPYEDEILNALDGLILLVMVLVVSVNIFPFLHKIATEISLVLVTLPLFLLCAVNIWKFRIIQSCVTKRKHDDYDLIDDDTIDNEANQ